jgi:hypothetical protein
MSEYGVGSRPRPPNDYSLSLLQGGRREKGPEAVGNEKP